MGKFAKPFVIVAIIGILVSIIHLPAAHAGGAKNTWLITKAEVSKSGGAISLVDQDGVPSVVRCDSAGIAPLMIYFGVNKPEELNGFGFSGNTDSIEREIHVSADWALNMSPEDKRIEVLAKGILGFKSFSLPKGQVVPKSWFVKDKYLCKDIAQRLGERIRIRSKGACEITGASADEFITLPQSMCYDTLAIRQTLMSVMSTGGFTDGTSSISRIYRFTISADCNNAVQFDEEGKKLKETIPSPTPL